MFGTGFSLGRISGIEVRVDWSLLIIFFLITFSLATGLFPVWHPEWSAALSWGTAVAAAVLFFSSVLVHELSHALVGRANGMVIRRITLFIFGGMAHMEEEPPTWRAELAIALIGPLVSLALGVLFLWFATLVSGPVDIDPDQTQKALAALGPLPTLLLWLGPINILLGLFNLVPGFPLDGGRALRAVMWAVTGSLRTATRWASRAGQGFAWLLMGSGVAMMLGYRIPLFGTGLVPGLWIAFIGWFLNMAALISYRQLLLRESLEDVPVTRLMQTHFIRIDPRMRLNELVEQHLMPSGQRAFPVEQSGRLLGMVCLHDVRKRERGLWADTTVGEIMTPTENLTTISAHQDAMEALELLGRLNVNQLPVLEQGRLTGLIRREDVMKWLSLHGRPSAEASA